MENVSVGTTMIIPVGKGLWRANLSLASDDKNASSYSFSFGFIDGKGVLNEIHIKAGFTSYRDDAVVQNVEFEGPGNFRGYLLPVNPPTTMVFYAYLRRIKL